MDEPIKLRDSRCFLIFSIVCTVFFALCLFFSTISGIRGQDMDTLLICIPIFGGLTLFGMLLFLYFFRRKLLLYDRYVSYTPAFGKTRIFSYSEIGYILPKMEKYIIYSYDGRKLAVFENNMPAFPIAYDYLIEKQVEFVPRQPLVPAGYAFLRKKSGGLDKPFHFTDMDDYIASHCSVQKIERQKKATRIFSILMMILWLMAIRFPKRWMLLTYILILLSNYLLCLALYPKLSLESGKKCDGYHITVPFWPNILSMLFLLVFLETINMGEGWWFSMSAALTTILLIPYFCMLCLRKIREHPFKLLGVAALLFVLSLLVIPPVNYVTAGTPTHDTVIVLEKGSYRSSKTTRYFIKTFWRGKQQKMDISGSLYRSIEKGYPVRVCIRKSVFGKELWQVHR